MPKSNGSPSSFARCWRFWRNFCCLFGWYPVLVAPVITAGCLLSLYSSAGCDFVSVDIGFTPSNPAYNQSQARLGFFFYKDLDGVSLDDQKYDESPIRQAFHGGCYRYSTEFGEDFIDPDRTWKVSRIMAVISLFSSLVASVLSWLMVLTPLPASACWPTVLLPLVMLSFIAEGSKFLIFDIAACSGSVWLPSGVDSQPQSADACLLGSSAIVGVVAGSLFLASLLLVCLHTPDRRTLRSDYGLPSSTSTLGTDHNNNHEDKPGRDESSTGPATVFEHPSNIPEKSSVLDSRPPSVGSHRDIESSDGGGRYTDDDAFTDGGTADVRSTHSAGSIPSKSANGDNPTAITEEAVSSLQSSHSQKHGTLSTDLGELHSPERISESRLSKVKEMELMHASNYYSQDQNDVLAKLVSELDQSLGMAPDAQAQQRFM
jgi:hypothetical protein